jgi:hypothetical protein
MFNLDRSGVLEANVVNEGALIETGNVNVWGL